MTFSTAKSNTTERGYGYAHQKARREALKTVVGTRCTRCAAVFTEDDAANSRGLHYDHTDDRSGYLGFAHAKCNIVAGAKRGAKLRTVTVTTTVVTTITTTVVTYEESE